MYFLRSFAPLSLMMAVAVKVLSAAVAAADAALLDFIVSRCMCVRVKCYLCVIRKSISIFFRLYVLYTI